MQNADELDVVYKVKLRLTRPNGSKGKFSLNIEEGQRIPLGSKSPGMAIDSKKMAEEHVVLVLKTGELWVEDNHQSDVAVCVNNHEVDKSVIKPGDVIQVSDYSFEILEAPYAQANMDNATQFVDLATAREQIERAVKTNSPESTSTSSVVVPPPPSAEEVATSATAAFEDRAYAPAEPETISEAETASIPALPQRPAELAPQGRTETVREKKSPKAVELPALDPESSPAPFFRSSEPRTPRERIKRKFEDFEIPNFPFNGRAMVFTGVLLVLGFVGFKAMFNALSQVPKVATVAPKLPDLSATPDMEVPEDAQALLKKAVAPEFPLLTDAEIAAQVKKEMAETKQKKAAEAQVQADAPILFRADGFLVDQLIESVRSGNLDVVKNLIEEKGVSTEVTTKAKSTPLLAAAAYGQYEVLKYLVSKKANLDAQDAQGTTALMWATYKNHKSIVVYLLRAGANPNLKRGDGDRAMDIAKRWNRADLIAVIQDPFAEPKPAVRARVPATKSKKNRR